MKRSCYRLRSRPRSSSTWPQIPTVHFHPAPAIRQRDIQGETFNSLPEHQILQQPRPPVGRPGAWFEMTAIAGNHPNINGVKTSRRYLVQDLDQRQVFECQSRTANAVFDLPEPVRCSHVRRIIAFIHGNILEGDIRIVKAITDPGASPPCLFSLADGRHLWYKTPHELFAVRREI